MPALRLRQELRQALIGWRESREQLEQSHGQARDVCMMQSSL